MNESIRRFQGELAIRALRAMEPTRDGLMHPSSEPQLQNCIAADRVAIEKLFQDAFRARPVALGI